jgi:hypothetical protein
VGGCCVAVNPSGSAALYYGNEGCQLVSPIDSQWKNAAVSGSDVSQWQTGSGGCGIYRVGWISDTKVIALFTDNTGVSGVLDVATYTPGTASLSSATLIPNVGSARPTDFVLGPDGNTVIFTASNQGSEYLYKVTLNNLGAQPTPIGPVTADASASVAVLDWR